jgi:hypothetical protein
MENGGSLEDIRLICFNDEAYHSYSNALELAVSDIYINE